MMTATEIMSELARRGVHLEPHGDRLRFRPVDAVPPDLLQALRDRKPEILAVLQSQRPASVAPCGSIYCGGCYEVPGERKIQPPKVSADWLVRWEPGRSQVQ